MKAAKSPALPSKEEWDDHMATHPQYRGWCPFCVSGRGKVQEHKTLEAERDHQLPTLSIDYGYFGKADEKAAGKAGALVPSSVDKSVGKPGEKCACPGDKGGKPGAKPAVSADRRPGHVGACAPVCPRAPGAPTALAQNCAGRRGGARTPSCLSILGLRARPAFFCEGP